MLKYHTIDISCRAIPDEVSLIFNITGCTIKCPGCCEKALWKDKGILLTFDEMRSILKNYNCAVTCVCFMGGEHEPEEINALARLVKHLYPCLHTAWYSGEDEISTKIDIENFDYLKIGGYEAFHGPLGNPDTNQQVFAVGKDGSLTDITARYIRTEPDEKREDTVIETSENVETALNEETELEETETTEETKEEIVEEIEELAYKVQEENQDDDEDHPHSGIFMEI